jgi:hypothetical protein
MAAGRHGFGGAVIEPNAYFVGGSGARRSAGRASPKGPRNHGTAGRHPHQIRPPQRSTRCSLARGRLAYLWQQQKSLARFGPLRVGARVSLGSSLAAIETAGRQQSAAATHRINLRIIMIGVPRDHWEHCRRDHFSPLLARIEFFGDRLHFEFALSATPWRRNRRSGQRGQP